LGFNRLIVFFYIGGENGIQPDVGFRTGYQINTRLVPLHHQAVVWISGTQYHFRGHALHRCFHQLGRYLDVPAGAAAGNSVYLRSVTVKYIRCFPIEAEQARVL
jgi:hypothetical protein